MITVQRVVPTTLDAKSTFAFLSAFENTPTWDPGTPIVEKRTAGPVAVGSKFHAVAEFRGKRQPIDYVVTELSDDRIQLRGENKTVISVDTIEVRPPVAGSEVHYNAEFTLKGLAKLAHPVRRADVREARRPGRGGMRSSSIRWPRRRPRLSHPTGPPTTDPLRTDIGAPTIGSGVVVGDADR